MMTQNNNRNHIKKMLAISCAHVPFHDREVFAIIKQIIRDFRPDELHLLGDILDCFALSRFNKDLRRADEAKHELEIGAKLITELHNIKKDAKMFWYEGNHEFRLMTIQQEHPQLAEFYGGYLDILSLMKAKCDLPFPIKWISHTPLHWLIKDKFFITHGDPKLDGMSYSQHSSYGEKNSMDKMMTSGIYGHSHRIGRHCRNHEEIQGIGCTCELNLGYTPGRNWHHGFAIIYQKNSDWCRAQVYRIDDYAVPFNGFLYTPTGKEKL